MCLVTAERETRETAMNHDTHDPSMHSRSKECIIPPQIFPIPIPWIDIHLCALYFVKEVLCLSLNYAVLKARGEPLKARHIARYKKEEEKSGHLGETNQTWHCKSPKTYIKNSKLQHICFCCFSFSSFTFWMALFSLYFFFYYLARNLSHTVNFRHILHTIKTGFHLFCIRFLKNTEY